MSYARPASCRIIIIAVIGTVTVYKEMSYTWCLVYIYRVFYVTVFSVSAYYCFNMCFVFEFIVAPTVCCTFWMPYDITNDDSH